MRTTLNLFAALMMIANLAVTTAWAQNTPDDWKWVVDHFKTFGIWEVACDHRELDKSRGEEKRCYLRVVDVYAPRPDFGAAFLFVTRTSGEGLRFDFGFEKGTEFEAGGFAVIQDNTNTFGFEPARCEAGARCLIQGNEAERFAVSLSDDAHLRLAFLDRLGRDWERTWTGQGFAEALADLTRESEKRGL